MSEQPIGLPADHDTFMGIAPIEDMSHMDENIPQTPLPACPAALTSRGSGGFWKPSFLLLALQDFREWHHGDKMVLTGLFSMFLWMRPAAAAAATAIAGGGSGGSSISKRRQQQPGFVDIDHMNVLFGIEVRIAVSCFLLSPQSGMHGCGPSCEVVKNGQNVTKSEVELGVVSAHGRSAIAGCEANPGTTEEKAMAFTEVFRKIALTLVTTE